MRGKKTISCFLLGVGLCFVPAFGYGEIRQDIVESKVSLMDFYLLKARVDYMMRNPTQFFGEERLYIDFYYDRDGRVARNVGLPESVDTKDKICVTITASKYVPSDRFLDLFELQLVIIYTFIIGARYSLTTDMDTDIVAIFYTKEGPSAYFYQGAYHLWEKR